MRDTKPAARRSSRTESGARELVALLESAETELERALQAALEPPADEPPPRRAT
jgi:hypothetical protein